MMNLTYEQQLIIKSTGDIKINAVAGSGKTTTIIEYAKSRPIHSRILYLAFNKTVRQEAILKFKMAGLTNVHVETAHSLAYQNVVYRSKYQLKSKSYSTIEIAQLLSLHNMGEKHIEFVLANHISKFVAYFCNSNKEKIRELNYLDIVVDEEARDFVTHHYDYIEQQSRVFLAKMNAGDVEITHDFYLKKFQLSNPILPYDYILFDEAQDASLVMLDVFLKQRATKIMVGDTHQQIYGWRFAVNSLDYAPFKTYQLSTSFRFSQEIAQLAMDILQLKEDIYEFTPIRIEGKGDGTVIRNKAVIARTNLGLLLKAIKYVTEDDVIKSVYFEGNFNSYTYAEDGASLYDVLNLYSNKRHLIRDEIIKSMKDVEELDQYIKQTEDIQMGLMLEIVKEYGNEIPGIIQTIRDMHVANDQREQADMIFSTVHRCKGMEYDAVLLVDDFITKEKLKRMLQEALPEDRSLYQRLIEEINLLYVAATRTKNVLLIPEELLPIKLNETAHIKIISKDSANEKTKKTTKDTRSQPFNPNVYHTNSKTKEWSDRYEPWTHYLDEELIGMYLAGETIKNMSLHFGRTMGAINSRIKKLNLKQRFGR